MDEVEITTTTITTKQINKQHREPSIRFQIQFSRFDIIIDTYINV